jgi:hypothetical protein
MSPIYRTHSFKRHFDGYHSCKLPRDQGSDVTHEFMLHTGNILPLCLAYYHYYDWMRQPGGHVTGHDDDPGPNGDKIEFF